MKELLQKAYDYAKGFRDEGQLVGYIPALASADKNHIAASIIDAEGNVEEIGDLDVKFTMMSIAKVVLFLIALEDFDLEEIKKSVGLKGSSKPYNSLIDLEMSEGKKPVNPFINAGALVVTSLIMEKYGDDSAKVVLDKVRQLADNQEIDFDMSLLSGPKGGGQANKAIIYSLQNNNIIPKNVDVYKVLDIYGAACAILVNTKDLARISYVLSSGGKNIGGEQIVEPEHARILRTLMAHCGTYDYAGDFAIEVGLPAKSGVGGGILATTNKGIGLASFCPGLDVRGNSVVGIKLLEYISKELNLGIY